MGMMSGQAPQQGGNPSTSHGNFNGVVDVEGQQIQVQKGIAKVEGQPYFVSDNGAMVVDHQGNLLGHVENSKFERVDAEYLAKMRHAGFVE